MISTTIDLTLQNSQDRQESQPPLLLIYFITPFYDSVNIGILLTRSTARELLYYNLLTRIYEVDATWYSCMEQG